MEREKGGGEATCGAAHGTEGGERTRNYRVCRERRPIIQNSEKKLGRSLEKFIRSAVVCKETRVLCFSVKNLPKLEGRD